MAPAVGSHSLVLLGTNGFAPRSLRLSDPRSLHPSGLAGFHVQLPPRPYAHREFLDDEDPISQNLVFESKTTARHPSPRSEQRRPNGHEFRDRLLFFRSDVPDGLEPSSTVQLARLPGSS